ncbi:MAG: aminotransferase [Pseudomonadota bacterium]
MARVRMRPPTRTEATFAPPVMEARRWLDGLDFSERPLINVSQAAPVEPPHPDLRRAMAAALEDTATHLYGPVLGLPGLRAELAAQWSDSYGGTISAENVAITSGCNQAFSAAIATLCSEGDEVILPVPYYFNHRMWLDMAGVRTVPLPCGPGLVPEAGDAAALITDRTRAIALVSPNNPTGAEYPDATLGAFYGLCRERGIALILDETYRDFHSSADAPHTLFERADWAETFIHLYSFSKAYRLTGHRTGAIITSETRMAEVEKFLDTVSVCPSQLGQRAALWGMQNLSHWLAEERDEILSRRAAIETEFPRLAARGWDLLGAGAYFAYVRFPQAVRSDHFAQKLVRKAGILCLPGTMFDMAGSGERDLRIAFANIDRTGIAELFDRLEAFEP